MREKKRQQLKYKTEQKKFAHNFARLSFRDLCSVLKG